MKKLKLWLFKWLKVPYCNRCLSLSVEYGFWSRAHDIKYGGSHGCRGYRCSHCGYIEWEVPIDVYKTWYDSDWKIYPDTTRYKDGIKLY